METLIPTDEEFFLPTGGGYDPTGSRGLIPNAPFLKQHFLKEGRLTEEQTMFILSEATRVLSLEPNLLEISGSTTGKSLNYRCPAITSNLIVTMQFVGIFTGNMYISLLRIQFDTDCQ